MFDLENKGHGHGLQHLQWSYSMSNIILYKSHISAFSLALTIFEILHLNIRDRENVGQGHDIPHSQWRHSMANALLSM